jgi:hypothetical protein
MKRYCIHIPGWVYAMTCYGNNARDAIDRFKAGNHLNRMPNGYAIWEDNA